MTRTISHLLALVIGSSLLISTFCRANTEAEDALLAAAAKGDVGRVIMALAEAYPDARDVNQRTPLMLAAKAGHFESVRRLLWAGADPELKDREGKTARDLLNPSSEAFAPLSLILRCYAFCSDYARPAINARIRNLVLVNDNWIDASHPDLRDFYAYNDAEMNGTKGADDDHNGFVDDIFGWDLALDKPLTNPALGIPITTTPTPFLKQLFADYESIKNGDKAKIELLKNRFQNPLAQAAIKKEPNANPKNSTLNDFDYVQLVEQNSHGTHVAGIVVKSSHGKAKVLGAAFGSESKIWRQSQLLNQQTLERLASQSEDYSSFVLAALNFFRDKSVARGRRASDYLRSCGAGVANLSWMVPDARSQVRARDVPEIYREHGKNPGSIGAVPPAQLAHLTANLPLEFSLAEAAMFALVMHENPDVLFVIAAGNQSSNNDGDLPAPAYLSRFFPNVITVASVNAQGKPSSFSNYGVRSVQIAAVGEKVNSTILGALHAKMNGTSMAAPAVAGAAAEIRADYPTLSAVDVSRLLQSSARKSPDLKELCATSGILDPTAARAMAASWSRDNTSLLVDEARSSVRPGQDGPHLKQPSSNTTPSVAIRNPVPGKTAPPKLIPPKDLISKMRKYHVTTVAGSSDDWHVAMSCYSGYNSQTLLGPGSWPSAKINELWNEGRRIVALGGTLDNWSIVLSKNVPGNQKVIGYAFDQTEIAAARDQGYRITSATGWKDKWLIVMTSETGWGEQRFTLPTPLNEKRRQWLQDRFGEGFRITEVAGDDTPNDPDDGWLFILTKGTEIKEQTVSSIGPWPSQWIKERSGEGFRVTSASGSGNHMIVVMSKGVALQYQQFSPGGDYPLDWIKDLW